MSDLDPNADRLDVTRTTFGPGVVTEVRRTSIANNPAAVWAVGIIGAVTIAAVRPGRPGFP